MDDNMGFNAAKEEASSSSRAMARTTRDMFVALVAEGFTEKQAIGIVSEMLSATISAQVFKED